MASERKKFLVFKILIAVGFALSIVLLIETITTYQYVSGGLLLQEVDRDSQRKVNALVGAVRSAQTQDMEVIREILQEFLADWHRQVVWIRILDDTGKPIAAAGPAPTTTVPGDRLPRLFSQPAFPRPEESGEGPVLVAMRSFRTIPMGPLPSTPGQTAPAPNTFGARGSLPEGGRAFRLPIGFNWSVEMAILPESVSGSFAGLRRNLIIGVSASLALMAALILIALRFPNYLRGQQLERELNLARRVQADLLPSAETISPYVDFSAECISAWEVGGDFCDVFHVAEDRTALVLGDVSGKGLSAALLMALVHGAIHSVSWTRSTQDHVVSTRQLNTLLCQKTASERFTSLFWGYFDPQRSIIQYVNAGHLPPLLLRKNKSGLEIHKLEIGGPVIGLLPAVNFQQGEEYVAPGDLLVAFSDGVVEAMSPEGEDFGERRLLSIVEKLWDCSASEIRQAVHSALKDFTGNAPVTDDETLIVVRFKHSAKTLSEMRSGTASMV